MLLQRREVLRDRPDHRRDQLLHHAVGERDLVADLHRLHEIVERHDEVDPRPGGRERHFQRRDDAGGAVGAVHLLRRVGAQLDHPRRLFAGHHARAQDVAGLAQAAVVDRADAARPAADEAADRRHALGRGMHPDLPAVRPGRGIEIVHLDARLAAHQAGLLPLDLRHGGEVEQHAAFQRHGLPVIAGRGAARGERDAQLGAGGRNGDHVRLVARGHDDIGRFPVQLLVQHRRIPEVIARAQPHPLHVGRDRHVPDQLQKSVNVVT